jgi:nitroreductase
MTRRFLGGPNISELSAVCQLALRAPSAGFSQGSHFLVLTDADLAKFWEVSQAGDWFSSTAPGVLDATAVILILGDCEAYTERYSKPDKVQHGLGQADNWVTPFWLTDAAMAAENLLLLIEEKRWGALLFGLFGDPRTVLDAFGVPASVSCVGAVAVGYRHPEDQPRGSPTTRSRRPTDEVIHIGHW